MCSVDFVPPGEATACHLVAFDKERDLLPLILANHNYEVEAGRGQTHTYNLEGLQKQIEDKFIRGRPKLDITKIEPLIFRQDSLDATGFNKMRKQIPQVNHVRLIYV